VTQYFPPTALGYALTTLVCTTAMYPGLVRVMKMFAERQYIVFSAALVVSASLIHELIQPHLPTSAQRWIVGSIMAISIVGALVQRIRRSA
jgi:phosphate/sulfate permease